MGIWADRFTWFYGDDRYGSAVAAMGKYGIPASEHEDFLRALVFMMPEACSDSVVYYPSIGLMDDRELDAGCRAWVKWHDDWRVFFTSHFLGSMHGSSLRDEDRDMVFDAFIAILDERLIPDKADIIMDNDLLYHVSSVADFRYGRDDGDHWRYYRLFTAMRSMFHEDGPVVLARLGMSRAGRLLSLMNHRITIRYTLTRKAAFSIAADLADADKADHGSRIAWFMSLMVFLGSWDSCGFSVRVDRTWVDEHMGLPLGFITQNPVEDTGRDHSERASALLDRVDTLTGNVTLVESLRQVLVSNDASPSLTRRARGVLPALERIPDAVWRIMGRSSTARCSGFLLQPWLIWYDDGLSLSRTISWMRRLARADDEDVWYRWAVFTLIQESLYYMLAPCEAEAALKFMDRRHLTGVPVEVVDYVLHGVVPTRFTYEYGDDERIIVHDKGTTVVSWDFIHGKRHGCYFIHGKRHGCCNSPLLNTAAVFNRIRNIPLTLDGFIGDDISIGLARDILEW